MNSYNKTSIHWTFIAPCLQLQGQFSEGLMHGHGIYTWADGVVYEVC